MQRTIQSNSPQQTEAFAQRIAPSLRAGDTLLLHGPVGAGKSLLCRALIQALQAAAGQAPEDVPSPSYTLVQTYAAGRLEIWHADLYRLSDPAELAELGLEEAFATALTLIEWPERMGPATPARTLSLNLTPDDAQEDQRRITLTAEGPGWSRVLEAAA
ncbi:MAG: tRNA (adenosine(37)-N6)-threonylcarbamoyltransferase complex ATPase subunit type 1 TsaE [Pseudomonadota bacterium]